LPNLQFRYVSANRFRVFVTNTRSDGAEAEALLYTNSFLYSLEVVLKTKKKTNVFLRRNVYNGIRLQEVDSKVSF